MGARDTQRHISSAEYTQEHIAAGWTDWEFTERELMECANATIFRDRPDLQFKFDASAPPLMPGSSQ